MRSVNLSCVRTCMVVAEERPRIALTQSFSKIFKDLGLSARAVSTTFGCRVNVAVCLQVREGDRREGGGGGLEEALGETALMEEGQGLYRWR